MISVSIVLYKTSLTELESVLKSVGETVSVIFIIDNYPNNAYLKVLQKYKNIIYIKNNNIGYGGSHNIALHKAIEMRCDYHIILNPDIIFNSKILHHIEVYMNNNTDVVNLMPKVIYPNGELQYLAKKLPNPFIMFARRFLLKINIIRKMNADYELHNSYYNKIINPPCLSGCFMFLRLSSIKANNLFFDERFFMYYEDYDLNRRCHRIGRTVFYPNASIIHNHARQAYKSKKMFLIFVKSTIRYFNKYGWFFDSERRRMNQKVELEIKRMNNC